MHFHWDSASFPSLVIYDMSLECWRDTKRASGRSAEDPPCPEDDFGRRQRHGWEIPETWLEQNRGMSETWLGKITMKWGEFMRTYGKLWEKAWKNIDQWRFWWAFPLCNGHFNGKLITLNWEFFSMPCLITKKVLVSEIWITPAIYGTSFFGMNIQLYQWTEGYHVELTCL